MDISLPEELEACVTQKVESGQYPSASDVIQAGLRLMQERDLHRARLDELRREIDIGIDQANRGLTRPFDEETLADLKARGRERLAARTRLESA